MVPNHQPAILISKDLCLSRATKVTKVQGLGVAALLAKTRIN